MFTHDSIGVGEDGPTHEPIEQLAGLRAIPGPDGDSSRRRERDRRGLGVRGAARRADAVGADTPECCRISTAAAPKNPGVARGAYILSEAEGGAPDVILIGTGSEVAALREGAGEAEGATGVKARVVSMPSWELFDGQDAAYRESVLPKQRQEARHRGGRIAARLVPLDRRRRCGDRG